MVNRGEYVCQVEHAARQTPFQGIGYETEQEFAVEAKHLVVLVDLAGDQVERCRRLSSLCETQERLTKAQVQVPGPTPISIRPPKTLVCRRVLENLLWLRGKRLRDAGQGHVLTLEDLPLP